MTLEIKNMQKLLEKIIQRFKEKDLFTKSVMQFEKRKRFQPIRALPG